MQLPKEQPMGLVLGEIQIEGPFAWSYHDFKIAVDMQAARKIEAGPMLSSTIAIVDIELQGFE